MKKSTITIIIILLVVAIIAGAVLAIKVINKVEESQKVDNGEVEKTVEKIEEKLKIVDLDSKTRPYAVMINNNHAAWPQCGLKDAYIVYEIVVEGGISRMMALYKDADTAKIGSVRSARPYFLDYALENDAIFVHWGGSDAAYSNINSLGINDIDGMALEGSAFWRDKTLKRDLEHTGFTGIKELEEYADKKKFTRDTNKDLLLNYSVDEIDLSTMEGALLSETVTIRYSNYQTTSYEYDSEKKVYRRSMSGVANVDLETGEQYTAKNIITYQVYNYSADSYGRQALSNIGSGTGYYITDGYAVPITWEKTSQSGQTVYKYANGEEIVVNDGNTFIQIQPKDQKLEIEPGAQLITTE